MLSFWDAEQFNIYYRAMTQGPAGLSLLETNDLSWLIIWMATAVSGFLALSTIGTRKSMTLIVLAATLLGCTILLTSINNILIFYILWELATTTCWAMAKSSLRSFNAALGPLATNWTGSFGSIATLVMVILLIIQSGTLTIADLNTTTPTLVAILLFVGITFKSLGILTTAWFAGSDRAFATTNALLAGAGVVVVGIYPYLRITRVALGSHAGWQETVTWMSLAVALLFALAALRECDVYRLFSYVAFGQFCVLLAGFVLSDRHALDGASLGLLGYVASVIGLFLAAGLVHQATASRVLGQEKALLATRPLLALLFLFPALSVTGFPPFIGFTTKLLLTPSVFELGQLHSILWIGIWLGTGLAVLRAFQLAFLNVPAPEAERTRSTGAISWPTLMTFAASVAFLLAASFWQQDILLWLEPATKILSG